MSNKSAVLDLLKQPGNDKCADCGSPDPEWASYNLGVFLCIDCSGIHRMMGAHISRVKSVKLDEWKDDQIQFMATHGNLVAKRTYEEYVPPSYRRPTVKDVQVLREQWIRAKYERQEFMDVDKQGRYLNGQKTGHLWKKGKEDSAFQQRQFLLNEDEGTLKYFVKAENYPEVPKASLRLNEINVTFCPEKIGNPNGMQISYVKEGKTRSIYVYTDDGMEIIDWYNAIRSANYNRLKVAYPGHSDEDLVSLLSRDYVKEGWLHKQGPKGNEGWKKRWFTLDDRRLLYYTTPLEPYPKGEVVIGNKTDKYFVRDGVPPGRPDFNFSFTLVTPDREYYMSAESREDQKAWMEALKKTTDKPKLPSSHRT